MKIKFGNVWIAQGTDEILWPSNLANRPDRAVDESRPIYAPRPTFYDRKTLTTRLGFQVTRRHYSVARSEAYMLLHYIALKAVDDAMLILTDDSGTETEYWLPKAWLVVQQIIPLGLSSRIAYELTGGPPCRAQGGGIFTPITTLGGLNI